MCIEITPAQRQQRQNIRNFFLTATTTELNREIKYRKERGDTYAVAVLRELVAELLLEEMRK